VIDIARKLLARKKLGVFERQWNWVCSDDLVFGSTDFVSKITMCV